MNGRRLSVVVMFVVLASTTISSVCADGIRIDVTAGKHEVTDWVAEVTLDLAAAAKLLDVKGRPDRVAVFELQTSGAGAVTVPQQVAEGVWVQAEEKTTATRTVPVPTQVDKAGGAGLYTVAWRLPGKLAAGARRRFLIRFGIARQPVVEDNPIRVDTDENTAAITNGDIVLEHHRLGGGMITAVTVAGAKAHFPWLDKIYDGRIYSLARHAATRMDVVAAGPLRATIESESRFLDAGESPASKVRAIYRFTTYAGLPFTIVDGLVIQDFAHQWRSVSFMEIKIDDAGLTHYWADRDGRGEMQHTGTTHDGNAWAAAYNDKILIAECATVNPFVYDGPPRGYPSYVKTASASMTDLRRPCKGALVWGAGPKAAEDGTVQLWSSVLADPPKVNITFDVLGDRVAAIEQALEERADARDDLSGAAWAQAHVALTIGRVQASIARDSLAAGRFGETLEAIESCEQALTAGAGDAELAEEGDTQAGTVQGYPYLGNDKAVFVFAKPENGAGLLGVFDRDTGWEFLKADPKRAPLWRISVKRRKGGAGYENVASPCEVEAEADDAGGLLRFRWSKGVAVDLQARLPAGESLLRMRLEAKTKSRTAGLVNVTFPVIEDVLPLTPDARDDRVIETWGIGEALPSPLVSGKVCHSRNPSGLQFSALYADGLGLYVAEEDGETRRKELTWTPDSDSRTLDFTISHAVRDWGSKRFVDEYQSPGDIVMGPFHGDWYDAARLYRKWALTAPWCAKGPIYEREDYPKWLLTAPYWCIDGLSQEQDVRRVEATHELYELPITVCHTTSWWFAPVQTDREPEYFPPTLGSEGFTRTVRELQEKGIRIVCSTNGWNWDQDTESYVTQEAEKSAILSSAGNIYSVGGIGGPGATMIGMCPATELWRQTMLDVSKELIGRYGVDGIYYDFLTFNVSDCYNKAHGHAIGGGDYWSKAVHGFYELMRTEGRKLSDDCMLTGEGVAEFCIDVLDTFLVGGQSNRTPLFLAVYHGYTNIYGGEIDKVTDPPLVGRGWLWGRQNGWNNREYSITGTPMGDYYKKLLKCRWEFATPYLGYGEMLRLPRVEGDLPEISVVGDRGPFTVPAVEGSAWKAPDGSIGVFLLNYDDKPHTFTWHMDLGETGIDRSRTLTVSRWTQEKGLTALKEMSGGAVKETMSLEPWGLAALKMEVKP